MQALIKNDNYYNRYIPGVYRAHLMICAGSGCVSCKSFRVKEALEREIKKYGLENEILVVATGCHGFCAQGPIMLVKPDDIFYQSLTEEDIPRLVEEHLFKGRPLEEKMYFPPEQNSPIPKISDIKFFNKQRLIVLKNRGMIDPEDIRDYIARGGYQAMIKALTRMTPEEIIREIKDSGLRGRGGAGFPTGKKWESCQRAESDINPALSKSGAAGSRKGGVKYIICNADEGDPGAFMDRSIIESDPHSVLEGMIIGARAIGASCGYVYIRSEYPLAVKRLYIAIDECRRYSLLGEDILGTGFDFDITVFRGAGAFVCGESSALRASIEGRSPEPQSKFIHATEKGLWDRPTVLNNVETLANVPAIIERGASWFGKIGTRDSKGTKVFSLAGKVNNIGLVEVPMGITLREIVFDIGGGIPKGKRFKAVQTGGPSGGCIPESLINLPVDFDRLTEVGSMMGSGGMIVMDEDNCMVDVAKYFLDFLRAESCGKCTPCREGIEAMYKIVVGISEGRGKEGDIELLEELSSVIKEASLCGLGKSAPNPLLNTLRYFKDEYKTHIIEKKCPAGVCKKLICYRIDEQKCTGCMLCKKSCPTAAIRGEKKQPQKIDPKMCIRCGACFEVCKFKAVVVE